VDAATGTPSALPEHTLLPPQAVAEFDEMAALTRRVLGVPTATVTLVDRRAQIYPGAAGLAPVLDAARQTPLEYSYCQYVVASAEPLVVSDARTHPLLAESPAISENHVIAYAGMPLRDLNDRVIGSLCAIDAEPREWTDTQIETLRQLAIACSAQLQLVESKARAAVLGEQDRMALDLQESVARELLALSMVLSSARSQAQGNPVAGLLDNALTSVDTALTNLRTSVYDRHADARS
jgi:GAF domain-containing protein